MSLTAYVYMSSFNLDLRVVEFISFSLFSLRLNPRLLKIYIKKNMAFE